MPIYYRKKEDFEIVTDDEVGIFISRARRDLAALIAMCYLTGARVSEILTTSPSAFMFLKEKDDTKTMKVRLPTHKLFRNGKRITHIRQLEYDGDRDPFVLDVIYPYVKSIQIGAKVWPLTKRRYQQMLQKLNEEIYPGRPDRWLTFHYFRHSAITFIARVLDGSGTDIRDVTGHRSSAYEDYIIHKAPTKFKGRYSR